MRASVCSTWIEPRRRSTSSAVYGRSTPFHRGLDVQSWFIAAWARAYCATRSRSLNGCSTWRCEVEVCALCPFPLAGMYVSLLKKYRTCVAALDRVEFSVHDHGFTDFASAAETFRFLRVRRGWQSAEQTLEFFVKQPCDELRGMLYALTLFILNVDQIAMKHALSNHQAVNAIRGQVFHVSIEQAGASATQHSVTVANHGSYRRARAIHRACAHTHRLRSQIGIAARVFRPCLKLVGIRELRHRDRVLIGMPGPRAIHQAVCFVLFVLFENRERPRVQLCVFAARIEGGHAANGQNA